MRSFRPSDRRGFTLMEVMVATGAVSLMIMAFMSLFSYSQLVVQRARLKSGIGTDRTLGERFLSIHIQGLAPSFNMVSTMDDNGRNFFDLNSHFPIELRPLATRSRVLTLTPTGRREISLVVTDERSGPAVLIDPVRFYNWTEATISASGTLTYIGPNNSGYMASVAPDIWKVNRFVYFYVVGGLRSPTVAIDGFAQPAGVFTQITGDPPSGMMIETFGGLVPAVNPVTGSAIGTLDQFLRGLPSAGGSIPYVLVRGVEVVRYRLVESPQSVGDFDLTVAKWNATMSSFTNPQVVATKVTSVTFRRPSVADMMVSFKIETKEQ